MHVRFFLEWNRTRETNRPQASTQAAPKLSMEKAASVRSAPFGLSGVGQRLGHPTHKTQNFYKLLAYCTKYSQRINRITQKIARRI